MNDIIKALKPLQTILIQRELNQLVLIVEATVAMAGRVTMLGISRWTEQGGSYRTVQRFFNGVHDWAAWRWALVKSQLDAMPGTWIMVGDEVVVTKSGKETFGLGKFFSSIQNQVVGGLCFINISLVHVESRRSFPLVMEQLVRPETQDSAPKAPAKSSAKKPGRPKGSKNKSRTEVTLSAFQLQLQLCIRLALNLIIGNLSTQYFAYDGALGNNGGLQLVKQTGLHLISKLRHTSALYFPHTAPHSGRGKPKKYGDKFTVDGLTDEQLCHETVENNVKTRIYQVQLWHKNFPELLNVVVIAKTNLINGKTAKVLLFSDDLNLDYDLLITYYQLRFQIEFNFRDAKQHWGLEDFMNIGATQVGNAANFSMFMVTFSQLLLPQLQHLNIESMLDLKTVFRAKKYTRRIINCIGLNADELLIDNRIFEAAELGRIHAKAT